MGRPRKNERIEGDDDSDPRDERDQDRDTNRQAFEQGMMADANESPLFIDPTDWPEGMALRWIRIEAANAPDNANWSTKTRMGWTPVMRGAYPQIDARFPSVPMPGMEAKTQNSAIIFGGLCLCIRDMRLEVRDKKNQQKETINSLKTIETYLEGGSANFPRMDFGSTPLEVQRSRAPAQFKE